MTQTRTREVREAPKSAVTWIVLFVLGTFGSQGLIAVNGIISARMLGVEGRGQLALVVAVSMLTARLTYGGSVPVALAQLLARKGHLPARSSLGPLMRRWAPRSLVPCAAAAGYLIWLLRDDPATLRYGLAAGVAVTAWTTMGGRLLSGALQGEGASPQRLVTATLAPLVPFTLVLLVAFAAGWDWSAVDVVAANFGASVAGLAGGWALLRPPAGTRTPLQREEVWPVTRANYVNAIGTIDSIGLDRNLVGPLMGTVALGLYSAATAVANLSSIVGSAVAVLMLPRVSAAYDDYAEQRRLARAWVPRTAAVILAVVVMMELVIGPVIHYAFGGAFDPATPCARWLLAADGLLGFRRVLVAILQGQGRGGFASGLELTLTVLVAIGISIAALNDSLEGVGVAMFSVGVLSCLGLLALVFGQSTPGRHMAVR